MTTWGAFESAAPGLAGEGLRLLNRVDHPEALLATVRGDGLPRIHPISLGIVDGRLYAFINRSPKRADLEQDGRYALHTHQDPNVPEEFALRGRAVAVDDATVRSAVAAVWSFTVDESYRLFELSIESALLGRRANPDEWPPRYTSWKAPAEAPGARGY